MSAGCGILANVDASTCTCDAGFVDADEDLATNGCEIGASVARGMLLVWAIDCPLADDLLLIPRTLCTSADCSTLANVDASTCTCDAGFVDADDDLATNGCEIGASVARRMLIVSEIEFPPCRRPASHPPDTVHVRRL